MVSILYVDDEFENRLVFEDAVEDHFEVHLAGSADEALDLLKKVDVDVLVTDHRLGGATGVELCAACRTLYPHVRRVLVTAFGSAETVVAAINEGHVDAFLHKPWDVRFLLQTLKQLAANIALERRVAEVEDALREREHAEEKARIYSGLLHDLANAAAVVASSSTCLRRAVSNMSSRLAEDDRNALLEEVALVGESAELVGAPQGSASRCAARSAISRSNPTGGGVANSRAACAAPIPGDDRIHVAV